MTERITSARLYSQSQPERKQKNAPQGDFELRFRQLMDSQPATPQVQVEFSKHALNRAEERGIQITPDLIDQLKGSMVRAQAKGATNILAMDAEKAFIVNIPNAKVITAITQDEMKDRVFTKLDGAVFL